jgi:SAM-dependent methyltransferase
MGVRPIAPTTIARLGAGIYPSLAMLAGMKLDVFTPLKDGPLPCAAVAQAIGVNPDRLGPLLYALVNAGLLSVDGERFANTAEADHYLVRGRAAYLGGTHELYTDMWTAALDVAQSIRADVPQARHDWEAMPDTELAAIFRGLHGGALATGRQLAASEGLAKFKSLLDVGGGSGGLAIGACESCPDLRATVVELPRIAAIAREFVSQSVHVERIRVLPADVTRAPAPGSYDVAVLRNLIQVLSRDEARRVLANVAASLEPGGALYIVGHVLDDSRLAPVAAVGINLVFLSIYDAGQSYTEGEHRRWLAEAGLADVEIRYGAGPVGSTIIVARKAVISDRR